MAAFQFSIQQLNFQSEDISLNSSLDSLSSVVDPNVDFITKNENQLDEKEIKDLSISRLFWQVPEVSDRSIFIDCTCFRELFYNLWRTVLAKNKIVLDSALRLQSFERKRNNWCQKWGLNANNKSDGGPVPDSSRKN
ncbi:hypothetical protein TNCV_4012191 [Trichonephila clavipes]|nr:hypothetical protein TNCV_4012191 [Trichonephila clavipes]